jgi:hypothetical protein
MSHRRVVALVVVSLTAGGCASVRPPQWWPLPWPKSQPTAVARSDPRRDPSDPPKRAPVSAPAPTHVPTPTTTPEPDRLEPLYRAVKVHIAERRDDQAYRALIQISRINPQYRDCPTLLRDVRSRLVRVHYQEGLRLFREERLEDAIVEWRVVLDMDPAHTNARRNIEQAEQILKTLAEHQKR